MAGYAAGTARWATSVGNEIGQVLITLITAAEGEGLVTMAEGLMNRYQQAQQPPPQLLYVDRDCCGPTGVGKAKALFPDWPELLTRLDIYHFMRR